MYVTFNTYPGRYGVNFTILFGTWGLHIYLDFCWWSLAIEFSPKEGGGK